MENENAIQEIEFERELVARDLEGVQTPMCEWCYLTTTCGLRVMVDKEDFERLSQYKWRANFDKSNLLVINTTVRKASGKGWRNMRLGPMILGAQKGRLVRCIVEQPEPDYRKSNLLSCTMSERQRSLPKRRVAATSKYRGVCFVSKIGYWRADISFKERSYFLGHFESEIEAARAYNQAAAKYYGEFAFLNIIEDDRLQKVG